MANIKCAFLLVTTDYSTWHAPPATASPQDLNTLTIVHRSRGHGSAPKFRILDGPIRRQMTGTQQAPVKDLGNRYAGLSSLMVVLSLRFRLTKNGRSACSGGFDVGVGEVEIRSTLSLTTAHRSTQPSTLLISNFCARCDDERQLWRRNDTGRETSRDGCTWPGSMP